MSLRKNFLAVISVVLFAVILSVSVMVSIVSVNETASTVLTVLIGLATVVFVLFLKEKHLYNMAKIAYIAVIVLLLLPILLADDSDGFYSSALHLGPITVYTASLLPLISFQLAKTTTKYNRLSVNSKYALRGLILAPMLLFFFQFTFAYIIVSLLVIAVSVIILKHDGRLSITWKSFIIPVILTAVIIALLYNDDFYFSHRIEAVLTRGASDPYGFGWVRTVLDGIFKGTPFIGETTYLIDGQSVVETLVNWAYYKYVIILAKFGYAAFIGVFIVYAAFFVCLFKMTAKTNQSSFAKYTSLYLSLFLAAQAVYSLLGIFLFDRTYLGLTFMGDYTNNIVNCFSFGVILMLYIKRKKPSTVRELEIDESQESIIKKAFSFIFSDEDNT